MNEDNFPPLPATPWRLYKRGTVLAPTFHSEASGFTAEQMREYGRLVAEECAQICDENPEYGNYDIREKFGLSYE